MATIRCPDPHYQGTVSGLTFRDGLAVTEDPSAIAFCRAAGYDVTEATTVPEASRAEVRSAARLPKP